MTGAPAEMREQPVLLLPALVRHFDGDVEVAFALQRLKERGALDGEVGMSNLDLAAWLCMPLVRARVILRRAEALGAVRIRQIGGDGEWFAYLLLLREEG